MISKVVLIDIIDFNGLGGSIRTNFLFEQTMNDFNDECITHGKIQV